MPGRSSPLYRRIARHAGLATIFRQQQLGPAPATGSLPADQPGVGRQIQPVKARLLPADSRLPEAILLPKLPPTEQASALDETPLTPERSIPDVPVPIQTQPAAAPPVQPETQAARPAPQVPARGEIPSAAQVAGPTDEDRNWRRLQTIFHRHQEREQAVSATADLPEPSESVTSAPASMAENTSGETPAVLPPAQAGERIQPSDQGMEPAAPLKPGVDEPSREPSPQTAAQSIPIQRQTPAPPAGPRPPVIEQSAPDAQGHTRSPYADQAEPDDESAGSPPSQRLPLEAAWPVQRTPQTPQAPVPEAPPESLPESPKEPAESTAASQAPALIARQQDAGSGAGPEIIATGQPPTQAQGLTHLQQVKSSRPSASRIEVIPPRRPHPLREPEVQPISPTPPAKYPAETTKGPAKPAEETASQIQTQKEPSQIQQIPMPGQPAPDQSPAPRQVPTEIGPLPEDLWRLLGEEPPPAEDDTAPMAPVKPSDEMSTPTGPRPSEASSSSAPAAEPGAADTVKSEQVAIQRAIAAAESHPGPDRPAHSTPTTSPAASKTSLHHVLPPIQHLQTAINIPEIDGPTPEKPSQPKESELDLDELARQVYDQVRRRLEIEFERQHRRS